MPVAELRAEIADAVRKAEEAKGLAVEAKHEVNSHERECALRYTGITKALSSIKADLDRDRKAIVAERVRFGRFVWSLLGAIALFAMSLIAWLLVQVYTLEPLRVQAEGHRAAALTAAAPK